MFAKPYKLKSNNSLKNSEKKHLIQRIVDEFPAATEESAKVLVPLKSNCSCMKLTVHSGETVDVYVVDGVPVLLWVRERLLPTVCALWRLPDLVPTITIQAPVLPKIQNGAPLYLPGVALPAGGAGFPQIPRGAALAAATSDNAAAAAVGLAEMSSGDMLLKTSGVCMDVLQWTGDQLCRDPRLQKLERPLRVAPGPGHTQQLVGAVEKLHIQPPVKEEWPSLGSRGPRPAPTPATPAPAPPGPVTATPAPAATTPVLDDPAPPLEPANEEPDNGCMEAEAGAPEAAPAPPEDMDTLLQNALLSFIKLQAKTVELPLRSSLLYRNYLLPLCPPDRTLDVKKSSYKKVGKFLEAMQKEGLLEVREVEKGVDAVTALASAHPRVRTHVPTEIAPAPAPAPAPADGDVDYTPPLVREVYSVTAAVADLFAPLKKGTTLTAAEIRNTLTEYVKARGLTNEQARGAVALDAVLKRALRVPDQAQQSVKWDALMAGVQASMTACTEMRFADGTQRLAKAKLEPIKMQVVNRSGNKKVTLVSNLEAFGFVLTELARAWQRGAAAAVGVTRAPGAKYDQLLLQGDQTYFVARHLVEKYGLPKKFVEGADKALKKKKGT